MKSAYGKVVLITGASSGIGEATAKFLARQGFKVYGTSRKADNGSITYADDITKGFVKMVRLDVCDDQSVAEAVDYVMSQEGQIDVLINNAGFGISGAIEETSESEAYSQLNTNFFGVHRMCRKVLPIMREQKKGLIINIGSVAGQFAIPYQAMYSASKYALEAYTEALRMEVRDFGIRAAIVEPGDTRTGFTDNRYFCKEFENSVYPKCKSSIEKMIKDEKNGAKPEDISRVILKLIGKNEPPVRVTVGFVYKAFVFLKRFFPSRFTEFVLRKMYA
ncbi:MAG TPA: SDR family oxidoreductase [Clostridiales bacterium]|nr:SDR family oxidoreductase [Clostridiales bacterium]